VIALAPPGTSTTPSALDPAGSEAHRLVGVWWLIFALAVGVAVLVLALVVAALVRSPAVRPADRAADGARDRRFLLGGGVLMPVAVLGIAAVATVSATQALRRPAAREVRVEVTGVQWFWRIRYQPSGVVSANEVRLPADRPVDLVLRAEDVIHSFWVPQLAGKVDLIPGQTNHLRFTPQRIGVYRGQCAEFCGLQHAHMAFVVRVVPPADFDRWIADRTAATGATRAAAGEPDGREVFAANSCAGCHAIDGVSDGTAGPDLSDLGDRTTLAAGTLRNTPEELAGWIRDPSSAKPGAHMPPTPRSVLSDRDLAALVAYLEALR
jgi:cytochrome c oxidase subunit 2